MRVLFAGSSLYGSSVSLDGLELRPPAKAGDVERAVDDGAIVIGLVDGEFGQHGAVRHKEILLALESGVAILGASSIGALRAAECAKFGMIPIGNLACAYLTGALDDDAAVALTMAPSELAWAPLTEPLVDAEATLERLERDGVMGRDVVAQIRDRARSLHFTQRTDEAMFDGEAAGQLDLYRSHHVSQKKLDAELLVQALKSFEVGAHAAAHRRWVNGSPFWPRR